MHANALLSKIGHKKEGEGAPYCFPSVTTSTLSGDNFAAATPPIPSKSSSAVVDRGGDGGAGIASVLGLKSPTTKVLPTPGGEAAAPTRDEAA